jgi:hypothetical protein
LKNKASAILALQNIETKPVRHKVFAINRKAHPLHSGWAFSVPNSILQDSGK